MNEPRARISVAWRGAVAAVVAGAVWAAAASVVRADDVVNDVDMTIDAAAEVMSLTAGGPSGSTQLRIVTRPDDGKNGCNLTGQTELRLGVSSSDAAVALVSPDTVMFDGCGDVQTVTVTPLAAGSATVSLSQQFNGTGATFNLAPATFSVTVSPTTPSNTAPHASVTGVAAGASYESVSVPDAGCVVTDTEDGNATSAATLNDVTGPLAAFGLGSRTASCSYTDSGGLSAYSSITYEIIDTVGPTIAMSSRLPAANENGWNNTDVTVDWSCADAASGVVHEIVTATVSGEGANQSASGTCTDGAGNTAQASVADISIDKTPPAMELESLTPGGTGWHTSAVVATWSCSDTGGSGVVSSTVTATIDADGADQAAFGVCADRAGNTAAATVGKIAVDRTAPLITLQSRTPANDEGWSNGDVTVVWACADATSGVVSATVTATLTDDGADQALTGVCTDGAGNTASATEAHINIDKTAPVTTFASRTPVANDAGWNNTDVVVTWSCTDGGSLPAAPTVSATVGVEGADQTAVASCADRAGNTTPGSLEGINIDKTPPTITFESRTTPNAAGWNNGPVALTWICDDAGSGAAATTVSETISAEGRELSATGTCADRAGNAVSDTQGGVNIDRAGPSVEVASRTAANDNGWNNTPVTVAWTCADDLAGAEQGSVNSTVDTEGVDLTASAQCADIAGNTSPATLGGINIDMTVPNLTSSRTAGNDAGWNNTDVTVTWLCEDGLSGVASSPPAETLSNDGMDQSVDGSCTDRAGNTSAATVDGIDIDQTEPSMDWPGGPAAGHDYVFGSVPGKTACTAVDALSGPRTCTVTGYSDAVGSHIMTATATDRAGNQTSVTRSYTVKAWTQQGFYQPVDMAGVWNTVRNGSTVPLKFEVFAGGTELTDPSIATFTMKGVACPDAATATADIEFTTTGGTSLRYDAAAAGQFIQNWQTPKKPGGCYVITMTTTDGSSISANFKLK